MSRHMTTLVRSEVYLERSKQELVATLLRRTSETEMTNRYREIELGTSGIAYVRECLESGKTLARLLLQTQDLNEGTVVTRLPVSVDDAAAKDFGSGGKLPELYPRTTNLQPVPDSDFLLVPEIQGFLRESNTNVCIFEDSSANPTDPFLQSLT